MVEVKVWMGSWKMFSIQIGRRHKEGIPGGRRRISTGTEVVKCWVSSGHWWTASLARAAHPRHIRTPSSPLPPGSIHRGAAPAPRWAELTSSPLVLGLATWLAPDSGTGGRDTAPTLSRGRRGGGTVRPSIPLHPCPSPWGECVTGHC